MVLLQPNAFLGNAFSSRQDVELGLKALLDPLGPHFSTGGARLTLSSSGTHYDEVACQLETFARPLWGLASLLHAGGSYPGVERWARGLASGTDPDGPEFWGMALNKDQRMVEMAPISFALVMARDKLYDPLSQTSKDNLQKWLASLNEKNMPDTNWLFFRVFANLALRTMASTHFNPERLAADLDHLDTFQLRGDDSGWSRDGPESVRQLDYYSGSFAIMFSMIFYSKVCEDSDPVRSRNYRSRALRFALDLVHYFDSEGRCIPFGRSMIYRFAVVSTFSLLPFAFDELPSGYPLRWGHVKGLVLRHLRSWAQQDGIFRSDGTLNIGYCYENITMGENYSGGGSPYWCSKAFACLSVPDSHPFWTATELPWPSDALPAIKVLPDPLHIMVRSPATATPSKPQHAFLLSSGQACHYPLKAAEAKYGKYAYSSQFGFSVPTGAFGLEQMAADSMLALCDDPPEAGFGQGERWRVRREVLDARLEGISGLTGEAAFCLRSTWKPWSDVEVETWLFPPEPATPYFYLRAHRIRSGRHLRSAEAGWSMYGQGNDGRALVQVFSGETQPGGEEGPELVRAKTRGGVIGLKCLSSSTSSDLKSPREGKLIQGDANSNILTSRSVIPTLLGELGAGSESWVITAVFGMPPGESGVEIDWEEEWAKVPRVPDLGL